MFAHDRWTRASWHPEERLIRRVRWLLAAAMIAVSYAAQAHGIVGNRLFPGTLAFDDPAVMDELIFPAVTTLKHPGERC
jgi:hypothetical protein